jgi:hypothetical protein
MMISPEVFEVSLTNMICLPEVAELEPAWNAKPQAFCKGHSRITAFRLVLQDIPVKVSLA